MTTMCSEEDMGTLLAAMQTGGGDHIGVIDRLIGGHPDDARLHFLRGSLLAGTGRPIEAHAAFSRAVVLAPDFALARFQLGFFELTSGEAQRALATWEPLDTLCPDHYLATFATGLIHLINDRFVEAVTSLRVGMAANDDNLPLNRDMQLIIEQIETAMEGPAPKPVPAETSATSFLLGQLGDRGTTH